jgi:hypothetical protein
METHDGEGAVVVVDYMTRAPSGYLRGSSAFTAGEWECEQEGRHVEGVLAEQRQRATAG